MDPRDQVMFVFQVVLALGPVAVYFLVLGLANSQSRPCLISARADFTLLAVALAPVVLVPAFAMLRLGHEALAAGVFLLVLALFLIMRPSHGSGWVIYNIGPAQCRRIIHRACQRLGWTFDMSEGRIVLDEGRLLATAHVLPWLRNVTLDLEPSGPEAAQHRARFVQAVRDELDLESMLPSPTGASLVVIGASLLGLPMWYLLHHMDLIVDVVRQILFA